MNFPADVQRRVLVVGNVNVDVLLGPLQPWPTPGTETVVDHYELRVGGAAGNTALALMSLGSQPQVVATVGDDAFGSWLEKQLGPDGSELERVSGSTALTVGLTHPDGQRTFVSHLGHLVEHPEERLATALAKADRGDLLLICGYFLMPGLRAAALELVGEARRRGVVTLLDTGWPSEGWTEEVKREFFALATAVDAVSPNREELLAATGADELRMALNAPELSGSRVIVKLGADGAALVERAGQQQEPVAVAAPKVAVADTVGAGDTFNAGLLAGLQRELGWAEALRPAVRAASLAISSRPRRYPSWAELGVESD